MPGLVLGLFIGLVLRSALVVLAALLRVADVVQGLLNGIVWCVELVLILLKGR